MIEIGARVYTSDEIGLITSMLQGAFRNVAAISCDLGWQALIAGGLFTWGNGPQVAVWNANNHQVTILTLQLALEAVWGYMRENNNYVVAEFSVFDGANQVGEGYLITVVSD